MSSLDSDESPDSRLLYPDTPLSTGVRGSATGRDRQGPSL